MMLLELVFYWISQLDALYIYPNFNITSKTMKENLLYAFPLSVPPGINFNNGALRQDLVA
jgi:hypothetical protein